MSIDFAYSLLLITGLAVMLAQTLFRPVNIEHILFAVFCGSLSMTALQVLTADTSGLYPYIFALGTCATCNLIWLISRALFRGGDSLTIGHYLFAGAIAVLVLTNRSLELFVSVEWIESGGVDWLTRSVSEVTQLLSSTVLVLTFWESVRGYSSSTQTSRYQRTLFAATFFAGVFSCTVIAQGVLSDSQRLVVQPWLVVVSALAIIISTFVVVVWQHLERRAAPGSITPQKRSSGNAEDASLFRDIQALMQGDKIYLQHDLKMIDIANLLGVSEYRISRVIRSQTASANFNHYINSYRIAHAKQLLTAQASQKWTVLVISLESGFASLAPFNRAFKAQEGCTPNQYRLKHLGGSANQPAAVIN